MKRVICIKRNPYWLTPGKRYKVIDESKRNYRIKNDIDHVCYMSKQNFKDDIREIRKNKLEKLNTL